MNGAVVALETSARAASVAVRAGTRQVQVELAPGRAHASDLLPALDGMLAGLGVDARGIAAVLVGTGPGSYTGLRVGIATALGIVRGCGAAMRGVPSGESLCFGELQPGEEAVVLLDARAGEIYFSHYRRTADEIEIVRAPCVLPPHEVAPALPRAGSIFADENVAQVAGLGADWTSRIRAGAVPRAEALLALGSLRLERLGGEDPARVSPLYLRAFAVRQRRR